jgi:hypothetical protein
MSYDSTDDTIKHILTVADLMIEVSRMILYRALQHDRSKLKDPEKSMFDEFTPLLRELTYGSPEYKDILGKMGEALAHHYSHNPHHPEHYPEGISGMNLLDILEMFCDWQAASLRHSNGNFRRSLEHNKTRFEIDDQLYQILVNTAGFLEKSGGEL